MQHFLDLLDFSSTELEHLLETSLRIKKETMAGNPPKLLDGKTLTMIFDKPSTRTRLSFEVGMHQLGGTAFYVKGDEIGLGGRESISDVARVMSRYTDFVMIRTPQHQDIVTFSEHATVPVINGLSDLSHPCQIIADLLTIMEQKGGLHSVKIAYLGDGNNVCQSLMEAASTLGIKMTVAAPKGYQPLSVPEGIIITDKAIDAVSDADIVYTDVWVSMGQESEVAERERIFKPYQVTSELLTYAKPEASFMHCLPAHRELEVTNEVMESNQSIVFDQAENRLHAQKAILTYLGGIGYE